MSPFPTSRGHLNPGGIRMTRLPAGGAVAELVRHYWIPEWDLPAGRIERQLVLGYPVCNLVVERDVVTLAGPTTRVSHRDLTGRGWAVGALLRPAAGPGVLDTGMFGPPLGVAATADRELHARTGDAARLRSLVTDSSGSIMRVITNQGMADMVKARVQALRLYGSN